MKKKSVLLILLFVGLISVVSHASDVVADRPAYSAGDYWIFIDGKGQSNKLEFIREEKDTYVFSRGGKEIVRDFNLMDVSRAGGFPGPIIKFPLKKGAWWKHEFSRTSETGAESGKGIARYEATDYDKITVAAGTFQAWKVAVTIEAVTHRKGGGASSKVVGSATYWYAPDVKQVIKAETGKQSWELKGYKIK